MFVPGLANSAGRRADERWATGVKAARGGKCTKMMQEEHNVKLQKWHHPDLIGVNIPKPSSDQRIFTIVLAMGNTDNINTFNNSIIT
jgi:hypothetical protein